MDAFVQAGIIGATLSAQYALLALGFSLIFGILGVVNFAHGGFYVLGGYAAYSAVHSLGVSYPVAVLCAIVCSGLAGWLFEMFILERVVDDQLSTMMLTLGLYLVMTTGVLVIYGPQSPQFTFPVSGSWHLGKIAYLPHANLIVLLVAALAIGAVYLLLYGSDVGRALRALADDRTVATALGIRARRLFPLAFGVATALAGLTGAVITPILSLSPNIGDTALTTAFLTVILGGLGSLGGAVIAACIVGFVEAYSSVYLGGSTGALVLFAVVLILLVAKPTGLFGRTVRSS